MKFVVRMLAIAFILALSTTARAQEPELVTEIVVRVNNDIITRADYLESLRAFREELTRQMTQQNKSQAEIDAEYERLKSTVLDYLIDDLLLEQKAKELNLDVEAEVNQEMLEVAKQNGCKDLQCLENLMRQQGIDPEQARSTLRRRLQQQYVVQREVIQPIFMRMNDKDRREFYDKYKDKFVMPGEVTLSEIFLPLEGHTAAEVEQRAKRLVEELRAGLSFAEAVKKNTPASRATRATDGKLGTFKPGELKPDIAAATSTLKVGEVTEPIRLQDGYQIVRVDDRKVETMRKFDDPEVQQAIGRAIVMERGEDARKKYLKKLREEAFVDINKDYVASKTKTDK